MRTSTPPLPPARPESPLSPWQRWALVALVVAFFLFGGLAVLRAAFLKRPMTDLQVYLRAAWAVRTGADFYTVTDDNHWHYHYPPLLAILLTPLANSPHGEGRLPGEVPFAVSAAIWYVLSLVCLVAGVHMLARAVEDTSTRAALRYHPLGCRRWWALRLVCVLACLPAIGGTLMRGQVNLLLLLLLCGMIASVLRGRSGHAGWWLAGAICLKVIPVLLLVYPLWRRDWRWLGSCALGLILGLLVIPALCMGPVRTVNCYLEWTDVLARPALGTGNHHARDKELIETTATDSQSFVVLYHNTQHIAQTLWQGRPPLLRVGLQRWLELEQVARAPHPTLTTRVAHWLTGGVLMAVALLAIGARRRLNTRETLLGLGMLILLMILLSPVCHLHYFCLMVPMVMGLVLTTWETRPGGVETTALGAGLTALLVVNLLTSLLPRLPGLEIVRDLGLATYGSLLLWLAVLVILIRGRLARRPPLPVPQPTLLGEEQQAA